MARLQRRRVIGMAHATLWTDLRGSINDSEEKAGRRSQGGCSTPRTRVRREQERKQREQKRDQERSDKRPNAKRKEKEKAFESLISLPSEQQETRLGELAQRLDEDVAVIRDHFPQHLLACKAGLHQQIHGMSNSGPIRSRLRRSFSRSLRL